MLRTIQIPSQRLCDFPTVKAVNVLAVGRRIVGLWETSLTNGCERDMCLEMTIGSLRLIGMQCTLAFWILCPSPKLSH